MTDQRIERPTPTTTADVRNELWESRHQIASLRVELQRADDAYAALAVRLAGVEADQREADDRAERLASALVDYEALLQTRTLRWTRVPRRVWGWIRAMNGR